MMTLTLFESTRRLIAWAISFAAPSPWTVAGATTI